MPALAYEQYQARLWKPPASACPPTWEEIPHHEEPISPQEQSRTLNTEIDTLYQRLAALVGQRDSNPPNPQMEEQITQLFQRLRELQKQEGDLIHAMLASPPSGAIALGLALLENADELRAKYGPIANPNATTKDTNRPTS